MKKIFSYYICIAIGMGFLGTVAGNICNKAGCNIQPDNTHGWYSYQADTKQISGSPLNNDFTNK